MELPSKQPQNLVSHLYMLPPLWVSSTCQYLLAVIDLLVLYVDRCMLCWALRMFTTILANRCKSLVNDWILINTVSGSKEKLSKIIVIVSSRLNSYFWFAYFLSFSPHSLFITSFDVNSCNCLLVWYAAGNMNIVLNLLSNGASVDCRTMRGETPLHLAARANQTDVMRILLRNKADVNAKARVSSRVKSVLDRAGLVWLP